MSIANVPDTAELLENYEEIEDAVLGDTGLYASDLDADLLMTSLARFTENGDRVLFVDHSSEEYVEITLRIPKE